jgi:hypothetical protein
MKKLLQSVGALMYSTIIGGLLYLLFTVLVPWVMGFSVKGFLLYLFLGGSALFAITSPLMAVLAYPYKYLIKDNMAAKVVSAVPYIGFGILSVVMPWSMEGQYGLLQWLLAISLTLMIVIAYKNQIVFPFIAEDL